MRSVSAGAEPKDRPAEGQGRPMIWIGFACAVFAAAGLLLAAYVSEDEFEGDWICVGTMVADRFTPYPDGFIHSEILIGDGRIEHCIAGEPVSATYKHRKIQVELAAQIVMEYQLSMEEGRLIVTDQNGMRLVYERVTERELPLQTVE